jgi:hypothetical protein
MTVMISERDWMEVRDMSADTGLAVMGNLRMMGVAKVKKLEILCKI